MGREQSKIEALLHKLTAAELGRFPEARSKLEAPEDRGVYIIYDRRGNVLHVGSTPRAKGGIAQRLRGHLASRSSFVQIHFEGEGSRLSDGCTFRCIPVPVPRQRALLEALAIGRLCPAHIGQGPE
jgi:hypothetical protein